MKGYTGYLTHNNGYDAIVITRDGKIVLAAQIDAGIYSEFFAADPDFGNWGFGYPYNLDIDDNDCVDSFGTIYASREDGAKVKIVDSGIFEDRKDFFAS